MALADLLRELFPAAGTWSVAQGFTSGIGILPDGGPIHVLGIECLDLGVDRLLVIAGRVLEIAKIRDNAPILVLVDSGGQRMSTRDEVLGLNEYLAHLAKVLMVADRAGHRTIGLLYGRSAAGAFIATALATHTLFALPSSFPQVMDLAAMARVTKLPLELLQAKARSTAVFAPGLENMIKVGAITEQWTPATPLAAQLSAVLSTPQSVTDDRDRLGEARCGRMKAAAIAARVAKLACTGG